MPIEYRSWITRSMLRAEPEKLFVFGDNARRVGMGGQAGAMRGEPNAVGIVTKRAPGMAAGDFLCDDMLSWWEEINRKDWSRLIEHHKKGGVVVWPKDDIGTGLARLPEKAPNILMIIQIWKTALEDERR